MARQKLKSLITCFTPDGDYFAVLSPSGVVKIWNTKSGSLVAEWKQTDAPSEPSISCMACSFIGKKRRKEHGTCLLAVGSNAGEVFAVDVFTGEEKWKSSGCHADGIVGLSFTNRGRILHTVGNDGIASEMNSESGEVVRTFKVSKTHISSSASCDEQLLAIASGKIRIFRWESGKELLKFSADGGLVQRVSITHEAKAIVTSGSDEKHLQVWKCDLSSGTVSKGPVLSMRHPSLAFECNNGANGEDGLVVLSVSESGVADMWNLKAITEEEVTPTKVTVRASKGDMDLQNSGIASRLLIMAARLHHLDTEGRVTALIVYGSPDNPRFSLVDVSNPGEDIVITADDETKKTSEIVQGNGLHERVLEEVAVPNQNKIPNKKRAASDLDLADTENLVDYDISRGEPLDGSQTDDDLDEPTMGEKLASLNLLENKEVKSLEEKESSQLAKPPSADSVHVLLKQALHADDRALIINCLFTQNQKVIANSVSMLNPADVLKLLDSLISIIQSRGTVLACAIPWLRSLLLQQASVIMSQESSLVALNSLYQLIESRVSTFQPALQLSCCLDLLYAAQNADDGFDENGTTTPAGLEDTDESEEEDEAEDAMETDQEGSDHREPFNDVSDIEGSDDDLGFD
ncbi:uncharacterized protein LOC131335448 isoform X1 [Rhododendron vialii]|uniref:uncharacterized protein LOC131335448 isoform X1 n=1 Tax=Rhododendron vialii TaxID=182163 RepID=UPI00265E5DCA|nr:uncharacterized protein LOC131335448 isoform X1 [Rhododendron vialii]